MGKFDDVMAQYEQERQTRKAQSMTGAAKGLISTANAATLGLGGQAYGLAGGVGEYLEGGDFSKGYAENRDLIHAIEQSYKDEYPNIAIGTGVAASLPLTMFNPLPMKAMGTAANALTTGQKTARVLANAGRAGVTAAGYGAISGLGNSDANNIGGILQDSQNSALYSGIAGAGSYGALAGAGGVGRNLYQRTPLGKASAAKFADLKVAEALARDAEGKLFNASVNNPSRIIDEAGNMAAARMAKLPQGAPLASSSGGNLLDLTDIAAISGGATKQAVLRKQHELAAKEAARMTGSAAKTLGTGRPDYNTTIDDFTALAKAKSAPYYAQLKGYQYPIDDELRNIISRSSPFFARSNLAAHIDDMGGAKLKDALDPSVSNISYEKLQLLKQSLYAAEEKYKSPLNPDKTMGAKVSNLRRDLIKKLDELSPKTPQGQSIHRLADDAFGGDMQLKNAVEQGRLIFREDAMNIRDTLKTMSQSEKDAFRLGVYQAIVDKTGKGGGRTELLNNYKDPAITDRLKAVFGSDYRKFASKLAAEFELKKFQRVAGGSQTATRQQGLNDIELSPLRDASEGVGALASGSARGAINPLTRLWQGMSVPESVRTQIGKTLLLEGQQAQNKLKTLNDIVKQVNQQKQQNAIRYGSTFGQLYGGQQ
jgi:hypothetical protein